MRTIVQFRLTEKEKEAIKNCIDTIKCDCECQDRGSGLANACPFLMENGGCMLEAMQDILNEQEND